MLHRKHVLSDLEPYACTFQGCEQSDQTFDHRQDWSEHEAQYHRLEYHCNEEDHDRYLDETSFLDHMKGKHQTTFDVSQKAALSRMFLRRKKTAFGECALCGRTTTKLTSHLARHLERIALFALPKTHGADELDEAQSGDSNMSLKLINGSKESRSDVPLRSELLVSSTSDNEERDRYDLGNAAGNSQSDPEIVGEQKVRITLADQAVVPDAVPFSWDFATSKFMDAREDQTSVALKEGLERKRHETENQPAEVVSDDLKSAPKRILNALYFPQMSDQIEYIPPAHERTFARIFQDRTAEDTSGSNFVDWLRGGIGCYWIDGKAGSGKSTLMKFIRKHSQTLTALKAWAEPADQGTVLNASFFPATIGLSLGKSQAGLLRSLLFDILNQNQSLVPVVFPDLYKIAATHPNDETLAVPSVAELKQALLHLVNRAATSSLKICILIDGIDEFEGGSESIVELVTSISASRFVKFILSSRLAPTPTCIQTFTEFAHLQIQSLTYNDIRLYVQAKLDTITLNQQLGFPTAGLVTDICDRASGSFVWVVLAIRSLLEGLRPPDDILDLRQRIEKLPPDLEDLYHHLLQELAPSRRQYASRVFQIMMQSRVVQKERPVTLLQLSFVDERLLLDSFRAPIGPLSRSTKRSCAATEERLNSHCCGLLKIQNRRVHENQTLSPVRSCVSFVHESVAKFLAQPKVWADISSWTTEPTFIPPISLMNSCLYELKILGFDNEPLHVTSPDSLWPRCRDLLVYAACAEDITKKPSTVFLDEFDQTMQSLVKHQDLSNSDGRSWTWCVGLNQSFPSLAVKFGLALYLRENLSGTQASFRGALLWESVCTFFRSLPVCGREDTSLRANGNNVYEPDLPFSPQIFAKVIRAILQSSASPNYVVPPDVQQVAIRTVWQCFIIGFYELIFQLRPFKLLMDDSGQGCPLIPLLDVFKDFILHGAPTRAPAWDDPLHIDAFDIVSHLYVARFMVSLSSDIFDAIGARLDKLSSLLWESKDDIGSPDSNKIIEDPTSESSILSS